jgi:hypothetical protein
MWKRGRRVGVKGYQLSGSEKRSGVKAKSKRVQELKSLESGSGG